MEKQLPSRRLLVPNDGFRVGIEPDLNNENNGNNGNIPNPSLNGHNDTGNLFTTPIRSGTRAGQNGLRADFAVINGISKYYYDVQIVAINKDSGNINLLNTLTNAANNKGRKYHFLDPFFHPIIINAGGLMEKIQHRLINSSKN
ncbi:uncharacterized protein PgNI_02591 [Pyricularia grisea]|uniref:Uncharacterized protein n=1 Tax=Pyricularia grisea TaxID=148305 RepID=A0A6P8BGS2_PYRGI|nr:uncharacterized protein PgNI_02594 [Pyricularia grisea]XP_030986491.1 uncharacterized protein PgNI_02591 [Pyricularia grisea]TLD16066.1 hypothetical protein PgNI_02594 [Pyricularia grisea]TLD16069.1 hypothetical protein PgNI_02591 [Pyricularia grisea]